MTRSHMMRPHGLFLPLYLMGVFWGLSLGLRNGSCPTGLTCTPMGPAEGFLQCVGLPSTDTGAQHLHRLRSIMEALMDLYTFMRTSVRGVPVLSLAGGLDLSLTGEPLQNEVLVHMWLEVKMKPLLDSVSKELLTCLSSKNFSCNTYQLVVKELSEYYSDMDLVRRRWIYDFFMYPFLSRDGVQGCVEPGQNSVDWLMKNFGNFRAMARVKDFSTLYMNFSGLEVLQFLTPVQYAEIMVTPGVDNGTLQLVVHYMIAPNSTHNWTTPGYSYSTASPYGPNSLSIDHRVSTLTQVWNGFKKAFKPINILLSDFVTLAKETEVSNIRVTNLTQLVLNVLLSKLAERYTPPAPHPPPDGPPGFDLTNVEDWYKDVVMPILLRFLPKEVINQTGISVAFHKFFVLEHGLNESTVELQDVCSLTVNQCGLTDVVQDVAHVLHCAAQTQLSLNESTILGLLYGLTHRLSSLLRELANTDLHVLAADVKQIFSGSSSVVTQQHLTDPDFIQMWFRVKLLPLLPDVSTELLSCLSQKNFSCPVYQAIVSDLSQHMMEASPEHQERIYENFIYPFLLHHSSSGAQCAPNNSEVWLRKNFGSFSQFASISVFYKFNPDFSGVKVLLHLTPVQTAELLLLDFPPEKPFVVQQVFVFLLSASHSHFREVMEEVIELAPKVNVSCEVYTLIVVQMYGSIPSVSPTLEPFVWASIEVFISIPPQECVPENITCLVTHVNETSLCEHMSGPHTMPTDSLCAFPLEEYACAQLKNFTANHLASLLSCDLPSNSSHSKLLWKLLLTKLSAIVDPALDILAATSMQHVSPSAGEILDVLGEIKVFMLTDQELRNSSLLHKWFSRRLRRFFPHASGLFLRCLSSRNISCPSYQHILQIFSQNFKNMTVKQQHIILKSYILPFLSHNNSGPGCVSMNNSQWLPQNLGDFSQLLSLKQLRQLNHNFDPLDNLRMLTVEQCVELLTLPLSKDKATIIHIMFDVCMNGTKKSDFLIFLSTLPKFVPQGNLSCSDYTILFKRLDQATVSVDSESEFAIIRTKMALSIYIPYGCVIYEGECTVTITNETQICAGVNSTSLQLLIDQGQMSGRVCDFTVEELACASLSVLTAADLAELLNCNRPVNSSGSRASWKLLLGKVSHILDPALDLIANTILDPTQAALPLILDTIREMRLDIFPQAQINHPLVIQEWLRKLRPFLSSVSMDFLHCLTTKALSCSTYQHIVHALSMQQPHMPWPRQMYVYTHFIKVFLIRNNTTDSIPKARCYNATDPELNSTAWFADNMGHFLCFMTLKDFLMFGSEQDLEEFTVNPENVALLKHCDLPQNLMQHYVELLYQQNSFFNPFLLPSPGRCMAPGLAFTQLTRNETIIILSNLNCTDLDPQVSAALAWNFGDNIDANILNIMGQHATGMSIHQIQNIPLKDLNESLVMLSSVKGWTTAQASTIFRGMMFVGQQFDASSLLMMGTVVKGLPTSVVQHISSSVLQTVMMNPNFLQYLMTAPGIIQERFVFRLISLYNSSDAMIGNVPDEMACYMPRTPLVSVTIIVLRKMNEMIWKPSQAELFFSVMGRETAIDALSGTASVSSYMLQGFTCTSVRNFPKEHINKLVKACRRNGKKKVILNESQLTCMYNHIKNATDATDFSQYPHDLLLYYDYSLVPTSSCRSYFEQLGSADFSVFSEALCYKKEQLFSNAKSCLGISSTNLTQENVTVLGNMCCTLKGSYIENSDPSILERLKSCSDLTVQANAIEILLMSGNTTYGAVSTWNLQTLINLETLPLYLKSSFFIHFDTKTVKNFLKHINQVYKDLRSERKSMTKQIIKSIKSRTKRSTDVAGCTVGEISQVTISDEAFPIPDYADLVQFKNCLSSDTVRENLDAITNKVKQEDYLRVVLDKLKEAFAPSSPLVIPETLVQVLGPASRVATSQEISQWIITQQDTLTALMDSKDGPWEPSLAKEVIMKYLSTAGNSLGTSELNAIGGINLCSLDLQTLKNISAQSLRDANPLDVSSCSPKQKEALFNISSSGSEARSPTRSDDVVSNYQLIEPYIGGASVSFVKNLGSQNINMPMSTFVGLSPKVLEALNVNDVKGLLGSNLETLKLYDNHTVVKDWIENQPQADLDTLGIGLTGGHTSTTSAPVPTSTTGDSDTSANTGATTAATGTTVNTGTTPAATGTTANTGANTGATPAATGTTANTGTTPAATGTTANTGTTPAATGTTTSTGATTVSSASTTTTANPSAGTTSSNTAPATTKPSSGVSLSAPSGLSLLLLFLLFSTYQHIFT